MADGYGEAVGVAESLLEPVLPSADPRPVAASAVVNQYYFYIVDRDFGPLFIKLSSYFPCNGKVCLNGHEYLKRQLAKRGIPFEALDNGLLSCADPAAAQ